MIETNPPVNLWWCENAKVARPYDGHLDNCARRPGNSDHQNCGIILAFGRPLDPGMQILVDGYDLTSLYMRDATHRQVADALGEAGYTPEFWNEAQEAYQTPYYNPMPNSEWVFAPDKTKASGLRVTGPAPCAFCGKYVKSIERWRQPLPHAKPGEPSIREGHRGCLGS